MNEQTPPASMDIYSLNQFNVMAYVRNDRPVVITADNKPIAYLMPFNGEEITIDIPPMRGGDAH